MAALWSIVDDGFLEGTLCAVNWSWNSFVVFSCLSSWSLHSWKYVRFRYRRYSEQEMFRTGDIYNKKCRYFHYAAAILQHILWKSLLFVCWAYYTFHSPRSFVNLWWFLVLLAELQVCTRSAASFRPVNWYLLNMSSFVFVHKTVHSKYFQFAIRFTHRGSSSANSWFNALQDLWALLVALNLNRPGCYLFQDWSSRASQSPALCRGKPPL